MTPFQQFEVWLRRASVTQRATSGLAVALVLALCAWFLTPSDGPSQEVLAGADSAASAPATGTDPGQATTGGVPTTGGTAVPGAAAPSAISAPGTTTGGAGAPVAGATTGGTAGTVTTPAAGSGTPTVKPTAGPVAAGSTRTVTPFTPKPCTKTGDIGTTPTTIDVAFTLVDVGPLNAQAGIPSAADQRAYFQIAVDDLNSKGGSKCRTIVPKYYNVNPLDQSTSQASCIQIANARPFVVVDTGSLSAVGASDCLPQNKIPVVTLSLSKAQIQQYYPYYLTPTGVMDDNYRNAVQAFKQLGYLSANKGFKKMGLIYKNCQPGLVTAMKKELKAVGISGSTLVEYDLGCPATTENNGDDVRAAVLAFKNAKVTTVTYANYPQWFGFTRVADEQAYKPQYLITDTGVPALSDPASANAPNANNTVGAIDVIGGRWGEQNTPGYKPDAPTAACNKLMVAKGKGTVYKQLAGFGGVACALASYTDLLIENASTLEKNALAKNSRDLGYQDFCFPQGPQDFSLRPAGTPYGVLSWRPLQYKASTKNFQLIINAHQKPFA